MSASTLSCLGVYPRSNLRRLWCACNRSGASNMPRLLPGEWQSHCSYLILVYTILAMNLIHNDVSIPSLQRPKSLVQKPRQNPSRCRVSISSCPNSRTYFVNRRWFHAPYTVVLSRSLDPYGVRTVCDDFRLRTDHNVRRVRLSAYFTKTQLHQHTPVVSTTTPVATTNLSILYI